jgi:hypothetical protein
MQNPGHFWPDTHRWPCNTAITIGAPSDMQAEVGQAAAEWNVALGHASNGSAASLFAPGAPRLVPGSGSAGHLVIEWGDGSGSPYCGETNATSSTIDLMQIHRGGACASFTNKSNDLVAVLTHEMGHSLGFDNDLHKPPSPSHCAMHLESIAPAINATVCQHEVEWLLAGYNYRPAPPANFWTRPIATAIQGIPTTTSLQVGGSVTLTATGIRFERQNGLGAQPLGSTTVSWASDQPSTAVVLQAMGASTTVRGDATGTTTVRARLSGSLPLNALLSARLLNLGEPTAVTVTAPPGSFQVSSITGPATPITVPGTYQFQAVVVNPPPGTVNVRWVVMYSNGDTLDFGPFGGMTRTIEAYAGAYNIRVKATPRVGTAYGLPAIRDWPVCTEGGGEYFQSDPGPDAEEGC